MRGTFLVAFVLAACSSQVTGAPTSTSYNRPIVDQYLITFKEETTSRFLIDRHYIWLEEELVKSAKPNSRNTYGILHKYSIGDSFQGYAARLPQELMQTLKSLDIIAYVEQDAKAHTFFTQPGAKSWGLPRISQRQLPLKTDYLYPDSAGKGVKVYVVDTGVQVDHPEFEGRATWGATFSNDGHVDGNGHGTHCAGTIASKSFGVAKKAEIVAVKVLDNSGSGSYSDVIAGINWVTKNITDSGLVGKALASMSLGGPKSQAVNEAVAAAVRAGVPFSVAAGNSYKANACDYSPAGEPSAFTVAASDSRDSYAYFTNIGPCVDIVAPGVSITSTWPTNKNNTISGTSMACPHVSGVLALVLADMSLPPFELYNFVLSQATKGALKNAPADTVNLLLYNAVGTLQTTDAAEELPLPSEESSQDYDANIYKKAIKKLGLFKSFLF